MKTKAKNKKTYDELIAGYYGKSKLFRNKSNPDFVISKSFDNGEVLVQKPKNSFLEYVVQSSVATDTPFEEYIVPKSSVTNISRQSSLDATVYSPTQTYTPAQEEQTDLTNPLQDDTAKLALLDRLSDPTATITDNSYANPSVASTPDNKNTANSNPYNKNTAIQSSLFAESEALSDLERAKSTEDDFVKDMQAILTGQKVFDPVNKKTVDKSQLRATSQSQSETPASLPQVENKHAIFDQIAQSMEFAKAYDLGSIDLEKRFNDFDKIDDIEKKIPAEKKSSVRNEALSISKPDQEAIGNEEFIKDLDAIAKAANAKKAEAASLTTPVGCSNEQVPVAATPTDAKQAGSVIETNKPGDVPQQEQITNVPVTA